MSNDPSSVDLTGLRIREAVRALLIDDEAHVLLAHLAFPLRSVWVLPGGGLDPGESHDEGLLRELREEVGFTPDTIGPHLWTRTHIIPSSMADGTANATTRTWYPPIDSNLRRR